MPGSRRLALKLTAAVATVQTAAVLLATRAAADPSPTPTKSDDNCGLLSGQARQVCEGDTGGGSSGGSPPSTPPPPSTRSPPSPRAVPTPPPGPSTSSATR